MKVSLANAYPTYYLIWPILYEWKRDIFLTVLSLYIVYVPNV